MSMSDVPAGTKRLGRGGGAVGRRLQTASATKSATITANASDAATSAPSQGPNATRDGLVWVGVPHA